MGIGEMPTGFRLGNLKERVYMEDEVVDGKIILKRENCTLLGYYAASIGNLLSTFRDNLKSHLQWWAVLKTVMSCLVP